MTRWRQGQSLPHHVYRQLGDEPDTTPWPDGDPPVATFFDPDDALRAVEAVNGELTEDSIGIRAERDALRDELHHETQRRDDLIAELRRHIAPLEQAAESARRLRVTGEALSKTVGRLLAGHDNEMLWTDLEQRRAAWQALQ